MRLSLPRRVPREALPAPRATVSYRPFLVVAGGLLVIMVGAGLILLLGVPIETLFPSIISGEGAFNRAFRLLVLLVIATILASAYALAWLGLHVRRLFRESERLRMETRALSEELHAATSALQRLERDRQAEAAELRRAYAVDRQRLEDAMAMVQARLGAGNPRRERGG